jgi:MFS family permease
MASFTTGDTAVVSDPARAAKAHSDTAHSDTDEARASAFHRSSRFLVIFASLSALFAMGQFHRSSGGVLSTVFTAEFALNAKQLSLVMGAMFVAQGLAQLPVGVLMDRYGTRRITPVATVLAVGGCLTMAAAGDWGTLGLGRLLLGAGFAAAMMGTYAVLVHWVPQESLTTYTGRFLFVGMAGGLLATSPFAAFIEAAGWRTAFVWLAAITSLAAVLAGIFVRDRPKSEVPGGDRPASLMESVRGVAMVVRARRFRPILLVSVLLYCPAQVLLGLWSGPFLSDVHGLGPIERGYAMTAMMVGMSSGVLIYGPIEKWLNARRAVVIVGACLVSAEFAALAFVAHLSPWPAIALFVAVVATAPFFVVVLGHAQSLFHKDYAGRVVSTVNLLAITGIFIMQNATGLLVSAVPHPPGSTGAVLGYRLVFALMAVLFAGLALVYTRTKEVRPLGTD